MRTSTAGQPVVTVENLLFRKLGPGRHLNLGAGLAGSHDEDNQTVICVDHARPLPTKSLWVVADAGALPFIAGSFDGALLKDVLEHVPHPIAVLAEVRRVCTGGSSIVVTVPRAIPRAVWADATHLRGFTRRALVQALELAGWAPKCAPARWGGFPGAARLGLVPHLLALMRIPIFGHYFGTNWIVIGQVAEP